MGPPSKLAIATSSLQRLIKEEASYHKEATKQQDRISKLEEQSGDTANDDDGNGEYVLKQERRALQETQALFPGLKQQIRAAVQQLEEQLTLSNTEGGSTEDTTKAESVLQDGKRALES